MRVLVRGFTVATIGSMILAGLFGLAGPAKAAPTAAAPTITSGPAANSFTNLTSATFTFTHTNPAATFQCSLDAAKATTCTSPVSYTGLAVGTHTFSVKALVTGQKASKATTRSWTIDQTAPNAPTVSQPTSPTKNTAASITFSSSSTDVQ